MNVARGESQAAKMGMCVYVCVFVCVCVCVYVCVCVCVCLCACVQGRVTGCKDGDGETRTLVHVKFRAKWQRYYQIDGHIRCINMVLVNSNCFVPLYCSQGRGDGCKGRGKAWCS